MPVGRTGDWQPRTLTYTRVATDDSHFYKFTVDCCFFPYAPLCWDCANMARMVCRSGLSCY